MLTEKETAVILEAYMEEKGLSSPSTAERIANAMSHLRSADRNLVDVKRDTIDRLLGRRKDSRDKGSGMRRITADSQKTIHVFLVSEGRIKDTAVKFKKRGDTFQTFSKLCEMFGVSKASLEHSQKDYEGTFRFYANSEDIRDQETPYVVRGAMTFFHDYNNENDLTAREVQKRYTQMEDEDRPRTEIERWMGYFFELNGMCVIASRRAGVRIPKMYVLRPSRYKFKSSLVTELEGRMLKVGPNGGGFSTHIVMFRDKDALAGCNLLPATKIDAKILARLGRPDFF